MLHMRTDLHTDSDETKELVTDKISEFEWKRCRKTKWIGSELIYLDTVDSTNAKVKQLAAEGYPNGTLVVADAQTAGRGRRGRVWESPAGNSIYMSLLLKPEIHPDNASMLTLVAALALAKAISETVKQPAYIKWPNDIVMNRKKVCGILTEMSLQSGGIEYIVVGVGINVHTEAFPEELSHMATSLFLETGAHCNRLELIMAVWEAFEYYYEIYLQTQDLSNLVNEYNVHLVNRNQMVRVLDPKEPFEGEAIGITAGGELIVDTMEGRKYVSSGEVSVRGIYGYV